MKKKKVLNKILILVFIVTLIILININKNEIKGFVSNVFNIQRKASTNLKNATRLYFNAEVTKTYGNGDLILLENYDSSGNTKYALVDAGRAVNKQDKDGKPSTVIVEFLKDHNVNELEFVFITHSHGDHNGGLLDTSTGKGLIQYAIDNPSFKIKKIIMKEFDSEYSLGGSQGTYEKFIEFAIDKNIPVLGVSYASLKSDKISPNRSDEFKEKVTSAKEANFSSFNSTNTKFKFGSSDLTIINWELFNDEGKQIYTDSNGFKTVDGKATTRESVSNENNNTIGLLIKQGNKKAFLSGDINNLDANASTGRIGDEDRIKDEIGKVDFLKLGHHGYNQSNTDNYINVLKPDYVSITNDIGGAYKDIVKWLEKNSTNYLYTTSDQYGISVTITNNDVYLGFETDDSFKEVGDTTYYIPKGEQNKYADYLEVAYKVDYQEENISVSNWSELKNAIENTNDNCSTLDTSKKICYLKKQVITLNPGTWTADSMITIKSNQKVVLKSTQAITITRATTNTANPFFNILGSLDLGINNMSGTITLDGNKANVAATSSLIKIDSGTLNFYNNITLTNNMNKTTKVTNSSTTVDYSSFGSAIYGKNSIINMYGGTISNNEEEVAYTLTLSGQKGNAYRLATMGVGIYLTSSSKFNMTGGTIKGNKGINNSVVQTKENAYTYNYMNRGITQMCYGIGVYAVSNSVVNINGGSITDNTAINNSKLIMNPSGDSENISSIQSDNMSIYGVGLYVTDSHLTIGDGANISNNKATLKATAEIKNNTIIKGSLTSSVRGVNLYSSSNVLTINNATMNNAPYTNIPNITNNNTSSSIENYTGIGTNGTSNPALINYGGSAYITNNIDYNINKLTMANSTSDYGGATYITGSGGTISNSTFNKNTANNFGGALYLSSTNQTINLNNTTVTENKTLTGSGGGIYTYNSLNINGSSTTIKSNIAHTYGGGIMCKTNCIMYDGQILNNEATLNAGGGIRVDGKFLLVNGEIKNNKANLTGGGIDYTTGTYTKTGGTVSGNTAPTGNEIYPTSKDTTDTNPPVIKISTINDDYTKNDVTVTFTANDYEKGIKKVSVGSTTLPGTNGKYTYKVTSNGTYTITAEDNAGNKATEQFTIDFIDKTVPNIYGVSNNSTYTKATITAADNTNGSGIKTVKLTKAGKEEYYKLGNTLSTDGKYTITVSDKADNSKTINFIINKNITETDIDISGVGTTWTATDQTITITLPKEIKKMLVDDQEVTLTNNKYTFKATENKTIKITIVDLNNNTTTKNIDVTKIDKTSPSISGVNDNSTINKKQSIKIKDTDSGIKKITIKKDGKTVVTLDKLVSEQTIEVSENGKYEITAEDAVGNVKGITFTLSLSEDEEPEEAKDDDQAEDDKKHGANPKTGSFIGKNTILIFIELCIIAYFIYEKYQISIKINHI